MLFSPDGPHVVTLPPSARALDLVAQGLTRDFAAAGLALAEATIFVPSRRAERELALALYQAGGERPLLAPRIRTLADLDGDGELALDDLALADLAPAIEPIRRLFELARLVRRHAPREAGSLDLVRSLRAGQALIGLLDSAALTEAVDWTRLPDLVAEREFADHWRVSADFLAILAEFWPLRLKQLGLMEPEARRAEQIRRLGAALAEQGRTNPAVLIGSTGAARVTREFAAILRDLPRGAVILPGLDRRMDAQAWAAIEPGHPQAGLKRLIEFLGLDRRDIPSWPGPDDADAGGPPGRALILAEALRPAAATGDWRARAGRPEIAAALQSGTSGLSRASARDEAQAAQIAALFARRALAEGGTKVTLVTPDPGLALRLKARLVGFGLAAEISAGTVFSESGVGGFLRLILALAPDPAAPEALAALLRHDRLRLDLPAEALARGIAAAFAGELLRGPRRAADLPGLIARAEAVGAPAAAAVFGSVAEALAPLIETRAFPAPVAEAGERLARCAEALGGGETLWSGPDGELAASLLGAMSMADLTPDEAGAPLTEPEDLIALEDFPAIWSMISGAAALAPERAGDPRVEILGPLEARFARTDIVAMIGLNEGLWPAAPAADAFLSRAMRERLGLPSPDERIGLAARDFVDLASAGRVLLLSLERRDDRPAIASRWLWRLETFFAAADAYRQRAEFFGDGEALAALADQSLAAPARIDIAPPLPRPPLAARPRQLSVTQVETLLRDPYAFYARRILRLMPRRAFGEAADAALIGIAAHKAVELWILAGRPDGTAGLSRALESRFLAEGLPAHSVPVMLRRLERAAQAFVDWDAQRLGGAARIAIEVEGRIALTVAGARIELTARADRIELLKAGGAAIFDLKTGTPPGVKEQHAGLAPQLPLEAAMLMRGGFAPGNARIQPLGASHSISEFGFWRLAPTGFGLKNPVRDGAADLAEKAFASFSALMARFADPDHPYASSLRPRKQGDRGDYDLLARRAEWESAEDSED